MSKENFTEKQRDGFESLLQSMMTKRIIISSIVLLTFLGIIVGIGIAISYNAEMTEQWKEMLLLLLGAFIGSYGKIIDYWFTDTDKDKMLVQKMDEEDGVVLSNTISNDSPPVAPVSSNVNSQITDAVTTPQQKVDVEIDEDGDGVMDGIDKDGDGDIDEYFPHRSCKHVWGDEDQDGQEECLVCGLIKEK